MLFLCSFFILLCLFKKIFLRFYCIFNKEFSGISKFWILIPMIFFEKFPKISNISWNIFNFSKIEKTISFVPKLVQNHYIDQNLAKFSDKTPKTADFSLRL